MILHGETQGAGLRLRPRNPQAHPVTIKHYMLDPDGRIRIEPDLLTWARWMEQPHGRRIGHTPVGLYLVSTVFLGIDHRHDRKGPPILWETMVFYNDEHQSDTSHLMLRCSGSRSQAQAQHDHVVQGLLAGIEPAELQAAL